VAARACAATREQQERPHSDADHPTPKPTVERLAKRMASVFFCEAPVQSTRCDHNPRLRPLELHGAQAERGADAQPTAPNPWQPPCRRRSLRETGRSGVSAEFEVDTAEGGASAHSPTSVH